MQIRHLYLRNFRNHSEAEVSFQPGVNFIYGENASGKTNLLEAITLVAMGRSFRTIHLQEIIKEGASFFYLEAEIIRENIKQTVALSFDGQNKKLIIDSNQYNSFHSLLGSLPIVIHAPHDIELISGSPAIRRRFFNLHLAQCDPLYVHHLSRYWRAMKQRNCALRAKHPLHESTALDCWEHEMALSAAYLHEKRHELLSTLTLPLQKQMQFLSKERFEIEFTPSGAKNLSDQLKKNRSREQHIGSTLVGPHRDDFSLLLENRPVRLFASEGQKKTITAALRLSEWDRLKEQISASPLMGIDDFGTHLDEGRQALLRRALSQLGQVFITTPHLSNSNLDGHAIHISSLRADITSCLG